MVRLPDPTIFGAPTERRRPGVNGPGTIAIAGFRSDEVAICRAAPRRQPTRERPRGGAETAKRVICLLADRTAWAGRQTPDVVFPSSRWSRQPGSVLIDQSQKMTVAAMQMADKKVWAHRS